MSQEFLNTGNTTACIQKLSGIGVAQTMEIDMYPEPGSPQSWDRYAYVNNNPVNLTDPSGHMVAKGCTDGISCGGDAAAIVHNILISELPAIQPWNFSYQRDVEDSFCAGCWEDPVTGSNDPTGLSQRVGLLNNIGIWGINYKYNYDPKEIFTYLTYYEYVVGSIAGYKKVTSMQIINQSNIEITVDLVYFDVQLNSKSCNDVACIYPDYDSYFVTPDRLIPVVGIVPKHNSNTISLIPSGNQHNINNMFPKSYNISIEALFSNSASGSSWPLIIYPIK